MVKRKRTEDSSVKAPSVPVNAENWSESSKRSQIYDCHGGAYKDKYYRCQRCQRLAVFSAEAQRQSFEVRKDYVWQGRTLCEECFLVRVQMEREVKELQRRWKEERAIVAKDRTALVRWLQLLEELPLYGAKENHGQLRMLDKLLAIVK